MQDELVRMRQEAAQSKRTLEELRAEMLQRPSQAHVRQLFPEEAGRPFGRVQAEVPPPKFGNQEHGSYTDYTRAVEIWWVDSTLPEERKGVRVFGNLHGEARSLALTLDPDTWAKGLVGWRMLLDILRPLYHLSSMAEKVDMTRKMKDFKRGGSQSIVEFTVHYQALRRQCSGLGIPVGGPVACLELIEKLRLCDKTQLPLLYTQWDDDMGMDALLRCVLRLFGRSTTTTQHTGLVGLPYQDRGQDGGGDSQPGLPGVTLLGDRRPYGKPAFDKSKNRLKCRHCGTNDHVFGKADKCLKHLDVLRKDPFCTICEVKGSHTTWDCPKHSRKRNEQKTTLLSAQPGMGGPGGDRVSLASAGEATLLQLLDECILQLSGVLDDGSTHTCGSEPWLKRLEAALGISFPRLECSAHYAFGMGEDRALFSVEIPLHFRTHRFLLRVDIVPGCIPLLIGKNTIQELLGITNSRTGTFTIGLGGHDIEIPLREAKTTGHWLLPLSFQ